MTPSFIGRMATMSPGVLPSIRFASWPTARTLPVLVWTATTEGSREDDPLALDMNQGVGGTEIDTHIV